MKPALEPRRPTFVSDEFNECLRTVFEEQENRELQTYWEEFL